MLWLGRKHVVASVGRRPTQFPTRHTVEGGRSRVGSREVLEGAAGQTAVGAKVVGVEAGAGAVAVAVRVAVVVVRAAAAGSG